MGIGPNNSAVALGGKPNPLQTNSTYPINGPGTQPVPTYIAPGQTAPGRMTNTTPTGTPTPNPTYSPPRNNPNPPSGAPGPGQNGYVNPNTIPGTQEYNDNINSIFNASNDYLNQAEKQVRSDFPTVQADVNSQYGTNKGQLDVSRNTNQRDFTQQQDKTDYAHETALAAARRLYSELRTGYQQRFGGSTSAGDAANQYANVEQQRQMGQQNRSYQDTSQTINNNRQKVEEQYQSTLQALASQRDAALNQANRDFQNKLLQISQNRVANEQAKGQAKLQALSELRNQAFQIQQQQVQFQQALEAQRQAAHLQMSQYNTVSGAGLGAGQAAASSYGANAGTQPTSNLRVNDGGYSQPQPDQLTGYIMNPLRKDFLQQYSQ